MSLELYTFHLLAKAEEQKARCETIIKDLRNSLRKQGLSDADIDDRLAFMMS